MQLSRTCPNCQYIGSFDDSSCPQCASVFELQALPNDGREINLPQAVIEKIRSQFELLKITRSNISLEWTVFLGALGRILEHHFPARYGDDQRTSSSYTDTVSPWLDHLHWEELFLTTACAEGDEQAWNTLHSRYRNSILKAARSCTSNEAVAEELAARLLTELYFQPDAKSSGRGGKICQYHGLGSLEGWLKVVVTRMSIDQARNDQKKVSLEELETDLPDQTSLANAASLVEDREAREAAAVVTESLGAALGELDSKERLILSLYYLENLNLKDLAKMVKVHESTVSRMIERIRQRLRKSMVRRVRQRFRIGARELSIYLEIATTHCDIDVKKLLTK